MYGTPTTHHQHCMLLERCSSTLIMRKSAGTEASLSSLVYTTNEHDVFLGRGKNALFRAGNVRFRHIVAEAAVEYHKKPAGCNETAKPLSKTKTAVANEIIETIHKRGGRFLEPVTVTNTSGEVVAAWRVVDEATALGKTKQAIRDASAKRRRKASVKSRKMAKKGTPEPTNNNGNSVQGMFESRSANSSFNSHFLLFLLSTDQVGFPQDKSNHHLNHHLLSLQQSPSLVAAAPALFAPSSLFRDLHARQSFQFRDRFLLPGSSPFSLPLPPLAHIPQRELDSILPHPSSNRQIPGGTTGVMHHPPRYASAPFFMEAATRNSPPQLRPAVLRSSPDVVSEQLLVNTKKKNTPGSPSTVSPKY